MDYKNIQELMKTMSESNLTFLEIESEDLKIKLKKETEKVIYTEKTGSLVQESARNVLNTGKVGNVGVEADIVRAGANQISTEESEKSVKIDKDAMACLTVNSPIVGTYYLAASPEAEDFVKMGSKVKMGDTLCIIEAMKLMNEIEAEFDLEIIDILVSNGAMVEFGQPLFAVKKI
ncbi:MAG: acetyl-CoA carboxylase biotin carboxyl carrier protein [Eubacteriales bacterium]